MFSLHTGTWSGLPRKNEAALRKKQEARDKAIVAEVAALDEAHEDREVRPKSRETLIRWQLDTRTKDAHQGRVLPAPWAPRAQDLDAIHLQLTVAQTSQEEERSPKTWDREMVAMCGENARAALHGRACEFVEPYVPLMKKHSAINKEKVNLLHHQLPSPCNERGSGFHAALDGGRATVRYNLQLDGRRPFLAGAARGRNFCREPRFLPQQDLASWDQERVMAPERAYAVSDRGTSMFHDEQRKGMPAWKPAGGSALGAKAPDQGKKPTGQLSRVGAAMMKA
mmetsp:Transcript_26866/g.62994  ORF Transcript_26866/g.62994 Transcript_26866/m.62994 type:complete len:282 (+) Transcript_26866:41-886(+)